MSDDRSWHENRCHELLHELHDTQAELRALREENERLKRDVANVTEAAEIYRKDRDTLQSDMLYREQRWTATEAERDAARRERDETREALRELARMVETRSIGGRGISSDDLADLRKRGGIDDRPRCPACGRWHADGPRACVSTDPAVRERSGS